MHKPESYTELASYVTPLFRFLPLLFLQFWVLNRSSFSKGPVLAEGSVFRLRPLTFRSGLALGHLEKVGLFFVLRSESADRLCPLYFPRKPLVTMKDVSVFLSKEHFSV